MSQKTYTINTQKAISETLDGETIIINLETGCYYSMNPSGTTIWDAIIAGKAIPTDDPVIMNFLKILVGDGLKNNISIIRFIYKKYTERFKKLFR